MIAAFSDLVDNLLEGRGNAKMLESFLPGLSMLRIAVEQRAIEIAKYGLHPGGG